MLQCTLKQYNADNTEVVQEYTFKGIRQIDDINNVSMNVAIVQYTNECGRTYRDYWNLTNDFHNAHAELIRYYSLKYDCDIKVTFLGKLEEHHGSN